MMLRKISNETALMIMKQLLRSVMPIGDFKYKRAREDVRERERARVRERACVREKARVP